MEGAEKRRERTEKGARNMEGKKINFIWKEFLGNSRENRD